MKIKFKPSIFYCVLFLLLFGSHPIELRATATVCGGGGADVFQNDDPNSKMFSRTFKYQRSQTKEIATPTSSLQNQSSNFSITRSDFENHLAAGTTRTVQRIADGNISMDVRGTNNGETWTLPDFMNFTTHTNFLMQSLDPASTPYPVPFNNDPEPATNAFTLPDDLYGYYGIGQTDIYDDGVFVETIDIVFGLGERGDNYNYFKPSIQSNIPLQMSAEPIFDAGILLDCNDVPAAECAVVPGSVEFEFYQYITTEAVGNLILFDQTNPVQAIKINQLIEFIFFDENENEIGIIEQRVINWYSENGDYIIAYLEEGAPWYGPTSFERIEYQKIDQSSLPIQWSNFTAKVNHNQQVILNWQTTTETNNSHFIIEKSTDGASFTKIGEQVSKGNSSNLQAYNFTDSKPTKGVNYYRIQQIGNDGNSTISTVITAIISTDSEDNPTIVLYPNPGKDEVWFSQVADYQLFNQQGQLLTSGKAEGALDVSSLPVGTYFVKINDGELLQWMKQ